MNPRGDDILTKINKSIEKPYIPARDSREVNVVDRIKKLKEREPVVVQDEVIEYEEIHRIVPTIEERIPAGCPGGFVKLDERGLIDLAYLPPSAGGSSVKTAKTHLEFPTIGSPDVIYVATEENSGKGYIYVWCESLKCYERPDDSLGNVSEIYGGSASDL